MTTTADVAKAWADRCVKCEDGGWVCEDHPDRPDYPCCGGAGQPCECRMTTKADVAKTWTDVAFEFRMALCEALLGMVLWIVPTKHPEGRELFDAVVGYMKPTRRTNGSN